MWIQKLVVLLILSSILFFSCSTMPSHEISKEFTNSEWEGEKFKSLLVIAVYDDRAFRISTESILADELSKNTISAKSSFDLISDLHSLANEEQIRNLLEGKNYDAILIISTLEAAEEYDYESWSNQIGSLHLLGSDARWSNIGSDIDYYNSGKFVLDIGLWDTKDLKLIWDAKTDSYSQETATEQVKTFSTFVINQLRSRKFL